MPDGLGDGLGLPTNSAIPSPTPSPAPGHPTWVFGYGSIIWRPDFPHTSRLVGWVDEHTRRFWQGSPDHRGTPTNLGRVVTLVPQPGEKCWGVAYRLPPGHEDEVMAYLDHRERGGYVRLQVEFTVAPERDLAEVRAKCSHGGGTPPRTTSDETDTCNEGETRDEPRKIKAITYIANPANRHYLGPAPLDDMVAQIAQAQGESGKNADYVLSLASHLLEMGLLDPHTRELAEGLRRAAGDDTSS